ncbi:hypothetical protein HBI69_224430 [Parastagonospora nodorum]|nr:hypothetical protein HBI69_224430 [Parastagonospora nodorum]
MLAAIETEAQERFRQAEAAHNRRRKGIMARCTTSTRSERGWGSVTRSNRLPARHSWALRSSLRCASSTTRLTSANGSAILREPRPGATGFRAATGDIARREQVQ